MDEHKEMVVVVKISGGVEARGQDSHEGIISTRKAPGTTISFNPLTAPSTSST